MKRFENILCMVDGTPFAAAALERAVLLAENNHARLTVAELIESPPSFIDMPEWGPPDSDLQEEMTRVCIKRLENRIHPFRNRVRIQIRVLKGKPYLAIIRDVIRNHRDLVVKIPETQNWLGRLFGSDDMHLLRKCPCPVWMIKTAAPTSYRRILAAVDADTAYPPTELNTRHALNRQILEMAASLALSDFAELHVAHAWHAAGETMMRGSFMRMTNEKVIAYIEQVKHRHEAGLAGLLDETAGDLGKEALAYINPRTHLIKGLASREIPALASRIEADLVVMGTVGRTGVPGFIIGNTAETILNQIDCSVLAVKPPGFQTPVTVQEGTSDEIS